MATRRDIEHHPWDEEIGDPWAFEEPPLNRTAIPYTDNDTAELIDRAVKDLTIFRASSPGDAGAVVSVLVSQAGEAEGLLFDAVADARDHGYTWNEIADRLATSVTTARRRYAGYTNWRTSPAASRPQTLDRNGCIPQHDPTQTRKTRSTQGNRSIS
jgi:hypothetical protein